MTTPKSTLLVIQPTVTRYRQALFARLGERLDQHDMALHLATGGYEHSARGDDTASAASSAVPTDSITIAGSTVIRRRWRLACPHPDLVIVEQALKNLEAYPLLARRHFGGPAVAVWGQGRTYSTAQGPVASSLKQFLTRRAQWFFAYTEAGADYAAARGFPRTRISVLNNTIDEEALREDLATITADDVAAFQQRLRLHPGRTALFLGGVDRSKGIEFLLESARLAARDLPGFVLLVGGAGEDLKRVQEAERAGAPVRALGRLDGPAKALALRSVDVLAIPEWIGLVAVDSLVSGRPIVSTWHASHSPEHEYLEPERTAHFCDHEPATYAAAVVGLLTDRPRLASMQRACEVVAPRYSLKTMVDRFVEGVLAWDEVRRAGL